jgi:hypothetical protein
VYVSVRTKNGDVPSTLGVLYTLVVLAHAGLKNSTFKSPDG